MLTPFLFSKSRDSDEWCRVVIPVHWAMVWHCNAGKKSSPVIGDHCERRIPVMMWDLKVDSVRLR
jgi:hypothetical protein